MLPLKEKNNMLCESPFSISIHIPLPFLHPVVSREANVQNRMPLYHFATTDLPGDTIAPEMADENAAAALRSDAKFTGEDLSAGGFVDEEIMGKIYAYLVGIGFFPRPTTGKGGKALPQDGIAEGQKEALLSVGGRGALA